MAQQLANYTPAKCREMGWAEKSNDFSKFMNDVELAIQKAVGMSLEDLPDWMFSDCFEGGENPSDVAADMLADNGFEFED